MGHGVYTCLKILKNLVKNNYQLFINNYQLFLSPNIDKCSIQIYSNILCGGNDIRSSKKSKKLRSETIINSLLTLINCSIFLNCSPLEGVGELFFSVGEDVKERGIVVGKLLVDSWLCYCCGVEDWDFCCL